MSVPLLFLLFTTVTTIMTAGRDDKVMQGDKVTKTAWTERTPLPKLQLAIVFFIQFAEPLTATVIYPFINELVRATGITQGDEARTGYYAGLIESVFFISETLTVVLWCWSSDIVGRKPVLLLGPLGLSLAMIGFGLSSTFWPLVFYRCLQGFFNGNIGVSKSIIAEITDSSNIGDAYALMPLIWSSGKTVGPIIGGMFTRPGERWPDTLGKIALFRDYPYLLPCIIASVMALASFAISLIALKETLPTVEGLGLITRIGKLFGKEIAQGDESTQPLLTSAGDRVEYGATEASRQKTLQTPDRPKLSEVFVPDMVSVLASYGVLSFLDMANAALVPLVYSTSVDFGGLGMSPYQIGCIMGTCGVANGVLQALFLGSAMRRFGATAVYRYCLPIVAVSFCAFPVANAFARSAGYVDWRVTCVIFAQSISIFFISPCYASMTVLVVQTTPNPGLLGSANGVAQMVTSGMRSFAPFVASSLFAMSVDGNLVGGHLVYIILTGVVVAAIQMSRSLPTPYP